MSIGFLTRKISHSLISEYLSDALRNTIAVVLPIVVFFYVKMPTTAIGVGTGALMVCLTDLPGNRKDKFNSALISTLIFFIVAIITAYSLPSRTLLFIVAISLTFLLTMFNVLGNRLGAIGMMAIILMTFTIGLHPTNSVLYGFYVTLGCIWYYLLSLIQIYIFPFRSLIRAIYQSRRYTSELLLLRAKGYDNNATLKGFNAQNIRLNLKITTQHELIRQLLLGDKKAMQFDQKKSKIYLLKALKLMDLYEQVSAVHTDYPYLRAKLSEDLPTIVQLIQLLAIKLKNGLLNTANQSKYQDLFSLLSHKNGTNQSLILPILNNIENISILIDEINNPSAQIINLDYSNKYNEFLTTVSFDWKVIWANFNFKSSVFRYALRLTLLCAIAILTIRSFEYENYSYWLLLTMIIISRPSYSQTIKRNWERIIGTLIGLVLGWLGMMYLSPTHQMIASILFLFGFFAFNRPIYTISVIFITMTVLMSLNVYTGGAWQMVSERLLFTLLGSFLCIAVTFLVPIWNAPRLKDLIVEVIKANRDYAEAIMKSEQNHQTRLLRKKSQEKLGALSEAIFAAEKEPFKKNLNWSLIRRFHLLNYQFNLLSASFKYNVHLLSDEDKNKITNMMNENLFLLSDFNLYGQTSIPVWGDQPLDLLETTKRLNLLLKELTK